MQSSGICTNFVHAGVHTHIHACILDAHGCTCIYIPPTHTLDIMIWIKFNIEINLFLCSSKYMYAYYKLK
jgi:hypothetical protein